VQETTQWEELEETYDFIACDAYLQHSLCGAGTKNSWILHTMPFKPASSDGKVKCASFWHCSLFKHACPFPEREARPKILFLKPVTNFMFHLHPWQLFSVFIVYPHIYSEKNTTCSTEVCQENTVHKIISAGRSLEV